MPKPRHWVKGCPRLEALGDHDESEDKNSTLHLLFCTSKGASPEKTGTGSPTKLSITLIKNNTSDESTEPLKNFITRNPEKNPGRKEEGRRKRRKEGRKGRAKGGRGRGEILAFSRVFPSSAPLPYPARGTRAPSPPSSFSTYSSAGAQRAAGRLHFTSPSLRAPLRLTSS